MERENVVKMAMSSAASFEWKGDTGDSSNKFHLGDKKDTKFDIWSTLHSELTLFHYY